MHNRQHLLLLGTRILFPALVVLAVFSGSLRAHSEKAAGIRIKYILKDAVYLEAGSSSGILKGERLTVRREISEKKELSVIAEIEIESVASTSAAGKVISSKMEIIPGDLAYPAQENSLKAGTGKPTQEQQEKDSSQKTAGSRSKPQLREVNRIRGRLGLDYSTLQIPESGLSSSQFGFMLRMDATRLGGTHWNMKGYYRGRVQSRKTPLKETTLTDLVNRTYHLSLNYDNPGSSWVAGFGRLYIPWASSLSTIDGMYVGRRFKKETVGVFGGTTPDPSSWNYAPGRQMAGAFVNTERGSFESFRLSSTAGVALTRLHWQPERQFGFFENGIFYRNYLSVYNNLEVDLRTGSQNSGKQELLLSRSYTTVRLQPNKIISFDINQNYFRNIPTFDPRLIGTGLVDKFLFQGLSGGFRLALPYRVGIFANTGRSSRTGDQKASWNYMGGASMGDILHSGIRGEYRYSKFNSSFGQGVYQSSGMSQELGERFRFEIQAGQQSLTSVYTSQRSARFVNGSADYNLGSHYTLGAGVTLYRGKEQNYNQYFVSFGYRFDTRR
jgi:hypothetical protein